MEQLYPLGVPIKDPPAFPAKWGWRPEYYEEYRPPFSVRGYQYVPRKVPREFMKLARNAAKSQGLLWLRPTQPRELAILRKLNSDALRRRPENPAVGECLQVARPDWSNEARDTSFLCTRTADPTTKIRIEASTSKLICPMLFLLMLCRCERAETALVDVVDVPFNDYTWTIGVTKHAGMMAILYNFASPLEYWHVLRQLFEVSSVCIMYPVRRLDVSFIRLFC